MCNTKITVFISNNSRQSKDSRKLEWIVTRQFYCKGIYTTKIKSINPPSSTNDYFLYIQLSLRTSRITCTHIMHEPSIGSLRWASLLMWGNVLKGHHSTSNSPRMLNMQLHLYSFEMQQCIRYPLVQCLGDLTQNLFAKEVPVLCARISNY